MGVERRRRRHRGMLRRGPWWILSVLSTGVGHAAREGRACFGRATSFAVMRRSMRFTPALHPPSTRSQGQCRHGHGAVRAALLEDADLKSLLTHLSTELQRRFTIEIRRAREEIEPLRATNGVAQSSPRSEVSAFDESTAIDVGAHEREAIRAAGTAREASRIARARIDHIPLFDRSKQRRELPLIGLVGRTVSHVAARGDEPSVGFRTRRPPAHDSFCVAHRIEQLDDRSGPIEPRRHEEEAVVRLVPDGVGKRQHRTGGRCNGRSFRVDPRARCCRSAREQTPYDDAPPHGE